MSAEERIQKLEELLARVKVRAAEPRKESAVFAAAGSQEPVGSAPLTSVPPTNAFTAEEEAALADEYGDVEVSSEVVEIDVDVDVDESTMEDELAAAAASPPAAELEVVEEDEDTSEQTPPPRPANEVEEPAPSSSPRPIHEAREPEDVPRHTPPPESGKQVAASTPPQRDASAFPPPPARTPSLPPDVPMSEPPPSLEGHTLIGGWREPGLGPVAGSGTSPLGVRVPAAPNAPPSGGAAAEKPAGSGAQPFVGASPGASGDFAGPKPARSPTFVPPQSPPAEGPEVTRPELSESIGRAGARVASFEGQAPSFAPSTFGELLDASLQL